VYTLYAVLQAVGDSIPGIQYVERGDSLIFWGTGDPTFLHPKLDNGRVYSFLKKSDKQLYYRPQENPEGTYRNGWAVEDFNYPYQTDIATFPIYGNLVRFAIERGELKAFPNYFDKTVISQNKKDEKFGVRRHIGDNTFEVSGKNIPQRYTTDKPFVWSDALFAQLLSDTLRKHVDILRDTLYLLPEETHTLYSVPRNTVLREMMLPSDNFLAEQLTMVAAFIKYGRFLTDSLRIEIKNLDLFKPQDVPYLWDGSGLSAYNKITPNSMVSLLIALHEQVGDDYALRMFFSAGGVDGTLKSAYHIGKSGPFVWAKTGTINAVYCQSGYLVTKNGRKLVFSFLNNNFIGQAGPVRREVVRMMTYIYENF
jgi:D-alanyl-D-alanine carboxypeptidase/D-alanyl-D-alanine-endopeptidase (penicillin-binding protein 4)